MPKQYYDIKTLQDYLAGRLDAKTMHALERQMLEDPLLQEALDGLAQHPEISPEALEDGMDRLSDRLADRVISSGFAQSGKALSDLNSKGEAPAPVKALYSTRRKWLGAAAVVLVLLAGGWLYFAMEGNDRKADQRLTKTDNEIASAISDALADSNAEKRNETGSNTPKINKTDTSGIVAAARDKTDERNNKPTGQLAMKESRSSADRGKEKRSLPQASLIKTPRATTPAQAKVAARSSVKVDTVRVLPDVLIAKADSPIRNNANDMTAGHVPGLIAYGAQAPKSITGAARMRPIQLRGLRPVMDSLYPDTERRPLYVIDGVPVTGGHLDSLNPADISHIEITKDQAAAAIYGSKAADGVVFITTKNVNAIPYQDTGAAYARGVKLLKKKAVTLRNAEAAGQPEKRVGVVNKNAQKALLRVHVKRINGNLQPRGGVAGLQNYLQQRLAEDMWKGKISIADTGRAIFEVRMEQQDSGRGTVITITDSKATHKGIQKWAGGWLENRLQWETDPGYEDASADKATVIEIELSKK